MHQGDTTDSYYQFYQPPFPNPNPNPNPIDSQVNPWPMTSASAPPVSHPDFASEYPPYSHNLTPTAPSSAFPQNPNSQFPVTNYHNYDHNPPAYYPPPQNHSLMDSNPVSNTMPSFTGAQYSSPTPMAGSYEDNIKYDHWGGFSEGNSDRYGEHMGYGTPGYTGDESFYKYEGGKAEPYGARGTGGSPRSSSQVVFDDYGRPINLSNGNGIRMGNGVDEAASKGPKVVKAIPKADAEDDVKGGVHKFRVKVLSEGYGQSDMDVLCEIGLDGIRMLDPATNRTLRIYPLEAVTKWEVLDSYIFAFWAKLPVDIEPKRIRLKSNSYTTNTILDIVTAASVQIKEIGEQKDTNSAKASQQQNERKKGLVDWMNLIKPPNEEKDHWVPDEAVNKCTSCSTSFNAFNRKHHCRNCGEIFCDKCTQGRTPLTMDEEAPAVRVCDRCMAEVTQRLVNAKEAANGTGILLSHEDLAKKLKEEMSKNSRISSGSKSERSQTRMREVACPTCTVHLQVEIPTSGSEKIECSVCQHPFLVSAD